MKRNQPAPVPAVPQPAAGVDAAVLAMASAAPQIAAAGLSAVSLNSATIAHNNGAVCFGNNNVQYIGVDASVLLRQMEIISQLQQQNSQLLDRIISQQETILQLRLQIAGLNV